MSAVRSTGAGTRRILKAMYTLLEQHRINEPRLLPEGPLLGASLLNGIQRSFAFRGHAIKYVLRGTEHYTVNGRPFAVRAGQYLAANPCSTGHIRVESNAMVAGLCADLPPSLVDGTISACTRPDELERTTMDRFFNSSDFLENRYDARNTRTGALMHELAENVHRDPHHQWRIEQEVYLQLAEAFVADNRHLVPMLKNVKAAKASTRKEILRGLECARILMHDDLGGQLNATTIAQAVGMSPFHFFRAFRSVHHITPHQYRMGLRLEHARVLLNAGNTSASEAAMRCGFADLPSFSKAFKKRFGVPPSYARPGSRRK